MGKKINIEDVLFIIRGISVSYCLAAIACTGSGVFTLWYAAPDIQFPYSSASGVWTGAFTFAIFVLGLKIVNNYDVNNPSSSRCKIITFYTFVIMDLSFGIIHVTFSAIGFSYCESEMRTGGIYCNAEERPRLLLMEGFSMAFGALIVLFSLATTVYLSVGKKINVLAGITPETEAHFTCCDGSCRCVTGCYY